MAVGFTDLTNTQRTPDRTMAKTVTPSVHKISFGDGYEMRAVAGINNIKQSYSVKFNSRPKAEIDDIENFFNAKAGVSAFPFTIPDTNASGGELQLKVVCDEYSVTYDYDDFYSCSATFRRVYEA